MLSIYHGHCGPGGGMAATSLVRQLPGSFSTLPFFSGLTILSFFSASFIFSCLSSPPNNLCLFNLDG